MANWVDVMKLKRRTALVLATVLLAACSLLAPEQPILPVRGTVIEDGSNRPLAGAMVYVKWMSYGSAGAGGSRTSCVRIDFATTDEQGHFDIPGFGGVGLIHVYKPGYVQYRRGDNLWRLDEPPFDKPQLLRMKPFAGTVSERIIFLQETAAYKKCGKPETWPKLVPFYRALYEEGKRLSPETSADRQIVSGLLFEAEDLELGMKEAIKRSEERRLRDGY